MNTIKGSLVPNITLFTKEGLVDEVKTAWHMQWMFRKGVDGLFLTGSYGAGPLMSIDERIRVFELAKSVASRYEAKILFPHVGCIDTAGTIRLALEAKRIGVDAIGSVPPFYYKHSDEIVTRFYQDLIESVDIPVFAYNNPETSRYVFTVPVVKHLASCGLAGLKDSPLSIGFLSRLVYEAEEAGSDFKVILGTSTGWLPLYHMGVKAVIAGMNNWAPEIMTLLISSTFKGDWDTARKAYLVMMDLSALMHFTDSTIASHLALAARGFDPGFPRKPMMLPSNAVQRIVDIRGWLEQAFNRLGLELETGDFTLEASSVYAGNKR